MTADTLLSALGIVMGISVCAVVIRVTRDCGHSLVGRLDLARAWAKTQPSAMLATNKEMSTRLYDRTISAIIAWMVRKLTETIRGKTIQSTQEMFGDRGSQPCIESNNDCGRP